MNRKKTSMLSLIVLAVLAFSLYFTTAKVNPVLPKTDSAILATKVQSPESVDDLLIRPGNKDEVFAFIRDKGRLPDYYITKNEARELGWNGGSLESFAPGKLIGGDYFGNFEGILPAKNARKWTEADIDTFGKSSRGAKRIVFSSDGLIYYTQDHYASFTKLGEWD